MEIKVVIGANAGDEGKGLVSGCLARQAMQENKKTLTVFYNGTVQRAHSFGDNVYHCIGTGTEFGSDTYYHPMFVVDPIALWLTQAHVYIDPGCRLILPCDILANRKIEKERGNKRHGSCGMGLFAAVTRSKQQGYCVSAHEMNNPYALITHLKMIGKTYPTDFDAVYNLDNFMRAVDYIKTNCPIITFDELLDQQHYDVLIYEGGQGLLLDQGNKDYFPHLTPSSVGLYNIARETGTMCCPIDLFYVSRTYMTRHGAGPMEAECTKEDINPDIIDRVNQPNEWQGSLRFGRIDLDKMYERIKRDAYGYDKAPRNINLVFTHMNYTDHKVESTHGRVSLIKPEFCKDIYVSDSKTHIERM